MISIGCYGIDGSIPVDWLNSYWVTAACGAQGEIDLPQCFHSQWEWLTVWSKACVGILGVLGKTCLYCVGYILHAYSFMSYALCGGFCQLNTSHLGRRNLNWRIASIILACGQVCGGIFLINDWCEMPQFWAVLKSWTNCREQVSKQHSSLVFASVSASGFLLEFLSWFPSIMVCIVEV